MISGDIVKIVNKLADGLKEKPAYLFIFAIWVMFVIFGFGSGAYGIISDKPIPLYLAFLSFLVSLIVAVIVIKIVEVPGLAPGEGTQDMGYQKLMYVKVLHLSKKEEGKEPFYFRVIDKLGGKEIPVFDETLFYSLNVYSQPRERYSFNFRSSGIIDLRVAHPWLENLIFPDKDEQLLEGSVKQLVTIPSNAYLIVSHHINGLQPGHEDFGMRMDEDTRYARLVVDFSSLPYSHPILLENPQGVLSTGEKEMPVGVIQHFPSVYSISKEDLKKGQVLRMDLKIDWEKL